MKLVLFFIFSFAVLGCNKGGGSTPPPQPAVSIGNASVSEGNGGVVTMPFAVTLNRQYPEPVTITYSTIDGTAKAGSDFIGFTNQQLTFEPNEVQKVIPITVITDDIREMDEEFKVLITGATNASLGQFTATGQISNDDIRIPMTNAGYDAPTSYPGMTLLWADEFNTGALDGNSWTVEGGDGCPNLCGWGNNELEYYTGRPENLFFQDGKIVIEARPESFAGKNYTSSKILTRGKRVIRYGRVDIRAKLPRGKGIWPALWMLPQHNIYGGWPTSGEIDIMEMVGHEPQKVHGTLHFGPGPGSTQISRSYSLPGGATFFDEFHVFSLEWKQDQVKIFVDNNLYSTVNKPDVGAATWPFNEEFFFIFNLAVGGNWPGNPDASTTFPQWMAVDYIRVYQ